ncbi:MAG: LysR family transcriptional regulator [Oscillospiraceae bacterium]|nr:LysR family transcriptional regulator [Oscillospiraceae bacterium]
MDIKKYRIFVRAAELGSFTRAAEELGLTQSGVSHALAELEEELGFRLLSRGRSGAALTAEGAQLIDAVRAVLQSDDALHAQAAEIRDQVTGTIRIGSFTSVAVHWLPGMMKEFQKLNPRAEFRLYSGDYHDMDQWMAEKKVDLAFVALPISHHCPCIPLFEDRLLAVLPAEHPLAASPRCRVADVAGEPFISLMENSAQDVRRAMDKAGVKPNVKFSTKDDYAILAMVSQGLGVSIVPALLLQGRQDGLAVRELDPPSSRTIALALPAGERTGAAAKRFAEFARQWIRSNYPSAKAAVE